VTTPSLPSTNAALRARLEGLLGEYEELRRRLDEAQRRMRALTAVARTDDGSVTVEVDSRSRLTRLEIDPRAYRRLSPSQLAAEIMRLHDKAAADVTHRAGEVMAPYLPAGASYEQILTGRADASTFLAEQPLTDETFEHWRARFSGWSTVDKSVDTS
jgi:DNA-binding protein YbaB